MAILVEGYNSKIFQKSSLFRETQFPAFFVIIPLYLNGHNSYNSWLSLSSLSVREEGPSSTVMLSKYILKRKLKKGGGRITGTLSYYVSQIKLLCVTKSIM